MDDAVRDKLRDLAQLDRDAVGVYDDALKHVDDPEVQKSFVEFRGEHEHHVTVITDALRRLTGDAPELSVDFMGRMAEFVTTLRSATGTKGALHAMRTAEKYHNHRYEAAAAWDVGDEALAASIGMFLQEEKHHLAFIVERLGAHAETE